MIIRAVGFVLHLAAVVPVAFAAAPKVDWLFPAGGKIGSTVDVRIGGNVGTGSIKCWCDTQGIQATWDARKKRLRVTIAKHASPGPCRLRIYNAEGASDLRSFVVGTLAETAEKEPNDARSAPQKCKTPCIVNGVLAKRGDVDAYAVSLKKGQTLVAAMTANRLLGSPMDAVLQLVSPRGFVLAQNDDTRGFDPRIVFEIPADGVYLVRTFAFPATPNSTIGYSGAASYIYRLTLTAGAFLDHVEPLAVTAGKTERLRLFGWNLPKNLQAKTVSAPKTGKVRISDPRIANTTEIAVTPHASTTAVANVTSPIVITGRIARAGEADDYRLTATKSQRLTISCEARSLGSPLDPVIEIFDKAGKRLSRTETRSSSKIDERVTFRFPTAGEYRVRIRDLHRHGGMRFVYRLSLAPPKAAFQLSLAKDSFVLPKGKTVAIPVAVARDSGMTATINVTIRGLPKSLAVPNTKSLGKGATAKKVTLTLKSAGSPWSGPITIVATAATGATRTISGWLTIR